MIDHDAFRAVLGRFTTGVTVVTAIGPDGQDQGMTVSAFCSLSLTPPLVLICIDHTASMYGSLKVASHFVVNILCEDQEALARRFSGTDPNRFDGVGYTPGSDRPGSTRRRAGLRRVSRHGNAGRRGSRRFFWRS